MFPDPVLDPSVAGQRCPGELPLPDRDAEIELIQLLREHGPREGHALAAYQQLIEESTDRAVQYLGRLILEDEQRHHRVVEEMLNELQSFVWEVELEPAVPSMAERVDPRLLDETRRLLAFEREDARELRRLRKLVRGSAKSSLLPLLVDLMLHDTAKHIEILKFFKAHTSRR